MLNERYIEMRKEKKRFLESELREYERVTAMTEEERTVLREWVWEGHSVHENGAMAVHEGGRPVDFLDVYREEEQIRRALASMSYEEGSRYLLEGYGIVRDGKKDPAPLTYEELKEKARRLYRTCVLYWEVLVANDLRDEAYEYLQEHIDEELPFESFEWDIAE